MEDHRTATSSHVPEGEKEVTTGGQRGVVTARAQAIESERPLAAPGWRRVVAQGRRQGTQKRFNRQGGISQTRKEKRENGTLRSKKTA